MAIWYVDTWAIAKLRRNEAETPALRRWLRDKEWIVSDLHRTERRRASARVGGGAGEGLQSARNFHRPWFVT